MDLKNISGIAELLQTITAREPRYADAFPPHSVYSWFKYTRKPDRDVCVWFEKRHSRSFAALQRVIKGQLESLGHPAGTEFVNSLIFAYAGSPNSDDPLKDLERTLDCVTTADISQLFVIPRTVSGHLKT